MLLAAGERDDSVATSDIVVAGLVILLLSALIRLHTVLLRSLVWMSVPKRLPYGLRSAWVADASAAPSGSIVTL
jgi:hypothetical protein